MAKVDLDALFSDYSPDYVEPWDPAPYSTVLIRLRTGREGIERVTLTIENDRDYELRLARESGMFRWYVAEITLDDRRISYYFNIYTTDGEKILFTRRGIEETITRPSYWNIVPGFHVPGWLRGAVMYQIYVDRFANGDPSNDVLTDEYQYLGKHALHISDWNQYPASDDVREFYGGDLEGVIEKLDYLKDLGIQVIYFNPLFVSPSNHKYDAQDYLHIDPHIGKIVSDEGDLLSEGDEDNRHATRYIDRTTNSGNLVASDALFAKLIEEAHGRGIRVIIDGVFNHCGSFNRWLDREKIYEKTSGKDIGAYESAESPYHNYFKFNSDVWPDNHSYEGWWGHDTLPKLNFDSSRELVQTILGVGRKWVMPPYNADGWRLDVAADLGHSPEFNHWFWGEFRKAVKQANPEAVILAENYGDSTSWLQGNEWDTIMNYDAFMEPLTWFLTGMEKHSDDQRVDLLGDADNFWKMMTYYWNGEMTAQPIYIAMNQLSNHDHSRFLTRTNHKVGRSYSLGPKAAEENVNRAVLREAAAVQFTWYGAPTLYYGDEAGVCGFTDPDNRRTYPWGHEDTDLICYHKEVIRIHNENPCLIMGSLRKLGAGYNYIAYGRFDENEVIVTVLNNNTWQITETLPVCYCGVPEEAAMERLMISFADHVFVEVAGETTDAVTRAGFLSDERQIGIDVGGGNKVVVPSTFPVVNGKVTVTLPPYSALIIRYRKETEEV